MNDGTTYYHKLRNRLLAKKGGVCGVCGTDQDLEIDHVRGDGGKQRAKRSRYTELRRLLDNPRQYQLLCRPCHNKKTCAWVRSFRKPPAAPAPSRAHAVAAGSVRYLGSSCVGCGGTERYTKGGNCCRCHIRKAG